MVTPTNNAAAEDRDYVAAMLDWVTTDVRQVYIRVTAAAALITLYITQIPDGRLEALNAWQTYVLFVGLGSLALAAGLYFVYVSKTHVARRRLARVYVEPFGIQSRSSWTSSGAGEDRASAAEMCASSSAC